MLLRSGAPVTQELGILGERAKVLDFVVISGGHPRVLRRTALLPCIHTSIKHLPVCSDHLVLAVVQRSSGGVACIASCYSCCCTHHLTHSTHTQGYCQAPNTRIARIGQVSNRSASVCTSTRQAPTTRLLTIPTCSLRLDHLSFKCHRPSPSLPLFYHTSHAPPLLLPLSSTFLSIPPPHLDDNSELASDTTPARRLFGPVPSRAQPLQPSA